jgi:hypothetical protein
VRFPAHIDFTTDIVSFGGMRVAFSERSRFLSKSEMEQVAHLELTTCFAAGGIGDNTTYHLNDWLLLYPNLGDILVHIKCDNIDGDEWRVRHNDSDYREIGLVSTDMNEARRVGEEILEQCER